MSTEPAVVPGQLVVVRPGSLVRRWASEEEFYTDKLQLGIVIQHASTWNDHGMDTVQCDYLVMFDSGRIYLVGGFRLVHTDHARDPSRLFGWSPG